MLPLFSVRIAELQPVWQRGVRSSYRACLSRNIYQFMCVLVSLLVLRLGCGI